MSDEKKTYPDLEATQSRADATVVEDAGGYGVHDEIFGDINEDGPNYRNVGWLGTAALMMKSQVGLGVLSIPSVFNTIGLVPGLICLWTIAAITTWSDYIVGVFKMRHKDVYGIDDCGQKMFGKTGRIVFGGAFVLYWIFVAGSGMLSLSIALNALSVHGTCTAVFVFVAFLAAFLLGSIQTLGRITWLAWLGLFGIMTSIFTLTVSVGVQDRPAAAPQTGSWASDWKVASNPSFPDAISAVSALVFAYAGTPGFFPIVSEMREPKHYTRSLIICQTGVTVIYTVIGIVVYYYCGSYVASPALGSAGHLMKKICYGLALPGLLFTTVFVTHIAAKYIFVHLLRGTKHISKNTKTHWMVWLGSTFCIALVAYIIASAIPVFGGLVSLVGALFGTLMSFQCMGCMWLYDNWGIEKAKRNIKWYLMVAFSTFVVVSGTFLMIAGTYGSVVGIIESNKKNGGTSPWSCADNSNST
ncbi:hypothetical protein K461DRAFT_224969 [Myriangium duriaei CBS 260.36]|uniref:Amino acid transporter transmembrane domain-containing protein n=1 Tax=Myriangium duriaei CBS 260.36 TaxID=1168546 RepID=A0A9P4J453_9PEZI|nr:hypothetical protein K461DRAFT_224969 [Myriangium duriaei CBS 260.36]